MWSPRTHPQHDAQRYYREDSIYYLLVSVLGGMGGLVVANVGIERSHEHKALAHERPNALLVCRDPHHAILRE